MEPLAPFDELQEDVSSARWEKIAKSLQSEHPAVAADFLRDYCRDTMAEVLLHLERTYAAIEEILAKSGESIERSGAGQEDKDLAEMKEFRHAVPEQINLLIARRRESEPSIHKLSTDMAVEPQDLRWAYELYRGSLEAEGLEYAIFGHAASGHLHVNVLPKDAYELARAKALYLRFGTEIAARGGAVAGEHGIGRIKTPFMAVQYAPEHLETMRRIKRFFDPQGILNPGVFFDS